MILTVKDAEEDAAPSLISIVTVFVPKVTGGVKTRLPDERETQDGPETNEYVMISP
jgi:hypothetical protein